MKTNFVNMTNLVSKRKSFEVFVTFNIDQCLLKTTDVISISLYYDEKLDVEKEKRLLDQFPRKCKLSERLASPLQNYNIYF